MIADGLSEAVCAEPAIRSLKSRFGMRSRITVCSDQGDLFRNHPAVERYGCADPRIDPSEFDQTFRLKGQQEAYDQDRNLVEYYAEQLGVQLVDRRPWICLDSFDTAEIRRFRLEETRRPRVAVAVGEDESEIGWKWKIRKEIHRRIMTELGATAIQIGPESWPILDGGVNLVGRLTCRETAAVLMDCDVLICGDNGYLDLAAGVQTPVIAILDPGRLPYRMDAAWGTAFEAIDGDTESRTDRCIHRVIQTATLYCRRNRQLSRGIEPA
ncbi:MAG: glycosyltransferase family 9 protein [Phycisphaerae bacterium]|nr:glycosyltransferase family 9 protein [Phycisphaerae bacterium]